MVRLQRVTFLALHNYLGLTNELFSHVSSWGKWWGAGGGIRLDLDTPPLPPAPLMVSRPPRSPPTS